MKKLILLLIFATFGISKAVVWEKTCWKNELPCRIIAVDGERALVVGSVDYSGDTGLKLTTDNGNSWRVLSIDSLETSGLKGYFSGNSIYLYWSNESWQFAVSTDIGKTWVRNPKGFPAYEQVLSLSFAGGTTFASVYGESGGVFKSTDGGASWSNVSPPLEYSDYGELSIANNILFLATAPAIYRSTDLGKSWTELTDFPGYITSLKACGPVLFTFYKYFMETEIWVSLDSAITWKKINSNFPKNITFTKYAFVKDNLFLASENNSTNGKQAELYMTSDFGNTWVKKNSSPLIRMPSPSIIGVKGNLIAYSGDSVCASTDFGKTWAPEGSGLPSGKFGITEFRASATKIYANLGNEIYVSNDCGLKWNMMYGPINYGFIIDMAANGDDLIVACKPEVGHTTSQAALFSSTDRGETWRDMGFKGDTIKSLFYGEGKILIKTPTRSLISFDGDSAWKDISIIWPNNPNFDFVAFAPGKIFTGVKDKGVKFSSDGGATWKLRNSGLGSPYYPLRDLRYVDGKLYARAGAYFYISVDDGKNWIIINQGLEDLYDGDILFDAMGNDAYVSQNGKLFYSGDAGANWIERESVYSVGDTSELSALKIVGGAALISIQGKGIFLSEDKGLTWKPMNDGLEKSAMSWWSNFTLNGDYVYCSSQIWDFSKGSRYGIYRAKVSDLSAEDRPEKENPGFGIAPNPAFEAVGIKDYHGNATRYTITNILGVETLSGSLSGSGINISSLPPGTYFLRIGNRVEKFEKM